MEEEREREREERTWPPTTATEGRASHRVGKAAVSAPWSPRTVQARWIRLTSAIKVSIGLCWEGRSESVEERKRSRRGRRKKKKRGRRRREAILLVGCLFCSVFSVTWLRFSLSEFFKICSLERVGMMGHVSERCVIIVDFSWVYSLRSWTVSSAPPVYFRICQFFF